MTKQAIRTLFLERSVLSGKSRLVRRPFCWKKRFGKEEREIFNEFAKGYRSEDEAWFCLCRDIELPICPVCKKAKVKFTGLTKNGGLGYNTTCENCSANAVSEKVERIRATRASKTIEEKLGIQRKRRETNKRRYGEESYMSYGSESFKRLMSERHGSINFNNREKTRETCLRKYGVTSNLLIEKVHKRAVAESWSDACRKRRIANCLARTGKKSYCSVQEVQAKMLETKSARIREIEKKLDCTLLRKVTDRYGQGYKRLGLEYIRVGGRVFVQNKDIPQISAYSSEGTHTNKYTSRPEKEVLEFVRSVYGGLIEENCTSAVPNGNHRFFELDIYLPELRLAIDFDGTYYHSTKFKDEMYHSRKTDYCRRVGIRMLHVFENEWNVRKDVCKDVIRRCIDGTFKNVLRTDGEIIVGDNSLPVFGDFEIVGITCPEPCNVGKLTYYDCGNILYKPKGER